MTATFYKTFPITVSNLLFGLKKFEYVRTAEFFACNPRGFMFGNTMSSGLLKVQIAD